MPIKFVILQEKSGRGPPWATAGGAFKGGNEINWKTAIPLKNEERANKVCLSMCVCEHILKARKEYPKTLTVVFQIVN